MTCFGEVLLILSPKALRSRCHFTYSKLMRQTSLSPSTICFQEYSFTKSTIELCSKRVASAYVVRLSLRSSLRLAYATTMAAYAHTLHTKGLTQHLREHNLAPGHSASLRAICFPSKAQHTTGLLRPRL